MIHPVSTHANFSVNNIEEAKKFYVDKLGLKLADQHEGGFVLESSSGTKANVYYKQDHMASESTVFGVEVDDVEAAVEELANNGLTVEKLPGANEKGIVHDPVMGDAAWLKDPAGNWVCINDGV